MNETLAIIRAFDEAHGEGCALATVVSVEGSAYRRPGARMLITASGESAGTISAGCLENDVIAHAQQVIASGRAKLVDYDTSSTGAEMAWGLSLGCNGVVRVLKAADRGCFSIGARRPLHRALEPGLRSH